ncbi:MAG: acyltransferase [Firmicutes bacterium]|nr:acyltransferase [Candidatus Colimorpha enterica]
MADTPVLDAPKKERNAGIELFRCVSMFLILVLHVLGQGGVIAYTGGARIAQYRAAWFLETLGYCSVNCYALISGYVNKDKELKLRRYVLLWLEVVFWLVVPLLVSKFFFPSVKITEGDVWEGLMPVTYKVFWYFNAYTLLFPFIPLLNRGLEKLSKTQHQTILAFLFITTSVTHVINGADNFVLSSGYSAMWLIVLYVFGAYFRIHGAPKWAKWYVTIPVFLLSWGFAWAMKIHQTDLLDAGIITSDDINYSILGRYVQYTSPFMVIMAVCLLIFFSNVKLRTNVGKKVITLMGKCSFGVYLFHVGPIMWQYFMRYRYKGYAYETPGMLMVKVLITALVLFIVFDAASMIRYAIFRYCGINKLVNKLADYIAGDKPEKGE